MIIEREETHYLAFATTYEMKNAKGEIIVIEDMIVWLGMSDNYPTCMYHKENAHKFPVLQDIQRSWTSWDGMPWMFRLKPNSIHIVEVKEKITTERIETRVI